MFTKCMEEKVRREKGWKEFIYCFNLFPLKKTLYIVPKQTVMLDKLKDN